MSTLDLTETTAATVRLLTADGEIVTATRDTIRHCDTILNIVDDTDDDAPVPLPFQRQFESLKRAVSANLKNPNLNT